MGPISQASDRGSSSGLLATAAAVLSCDTDLIRVLTTTSSRLVVRARTAEARDVVVKVDERSGAFDAEAAAMIRLASAGVAVSRLVRVDAGPPAVLIAGWRPGRAVTAADESAVLTRLGRQLRLVHRLPPTAVYSGHPSVTEWIRAWLEIDLQWWRDVEGARADDIEAAYRWWDGVRPEIEAVGVGTTILLDGRAEHAIVGDDGSVGLIDVADLDSGDPAMDLAVLELDQPGILDRLWDGYGATGAERARIERVLPFYVFLRALAGAEWHSRTSRPGSPRPVADALLVRAGAELRLHREHRADPL